MRILILILALLLFPVCLKAQDSEATFKQRVSKFKNNKRFTYHYDKFKDQTRVAVGPFNVGGDSAYVFSGSLLSMTAYYFFDGTAAKAPASFILLFDSSSKDWQYLQDCSLNMIVDGERVDAGQCVRQSEVKRGGVYERLFYKFTPEGFGKLAKAASVEMRVGRKELTLKDEHLQAFRDLMSLTQP